MTTFVDTTALFALLDEDDRNHGRAAKWLAGPGRNPSELLASHSYVIVESAALAHRRLGPAAIRVLVGGLVPALSVFHVDETLHNRAVSSYLAGLGRRASFVDRISFELMRDRDIVRAFCFDRDFAREGFEPVP